MTGVPAPVRNDLQAALGAAYTIERELGGGGMSRVFVATDVRLDRKIVVKVLLPELAAGLSAERFTREVRLAAQLQQANVVPVIADGVTSNGLPYYTMPFVEGLSLRQRLERGPLGIPEIVSILRDVARALVYAHGRGVVHRDIKPDNVLLSGDTAVVADFGIAKAISASRTRGDDDGLTQLGTSLGTPAYMAPEQAAGDPATDHRADVYAFGCLAYELLTGHPPFHGLSPHKLLAAHMTERPVPVESARPNTPGALARVVARCLAKDPEHRPQQAAAILEALDVAMTHGGRPLTRSSVRRPAPSCSPHSTGVPAVAAPAAAARWRVLVGAAALIALAGTGVALLRGRSAAAATTLAPARVPVLPFDNRTGDSALAPLGGMAADWITRGLTETGLVGVAPLPLDALVAFDHRPLEAARNEQLAVIGHGQFFPITWQGAPKPPKVHETPPRTPVTRIASHTPRTLTRPWRRA